MTGTYAGRGPDGRARYIPEVPHRPQPAEVTHAAWPPRTIRRALPIAQRPTVSRARQRARARITRAIVRRDIRVRP